MKMTTEQKENKQKKSMEQNAGILAVATTI